MKAAKKEERPEGESISLRGLVVDWDLPSKAALIDWIRKATKEKVRVKEVVELFPVEIFNELEAIRRTFYYQLERLTIPAYSLKLLPVDRLPEFQKVIENTRARLQDLDRKIFEALESDYTKRAEAYFRKVGEKKPRMIESISHRFEVFLMPLRLDRLLWEEFLDETQKSSMEKLKARYEEEKENLNSRLEVINQRILTAMKEFDQKVKDLEIAEKEVLKAEAEVKEAWEKVTVPYDVGLLRSQKKGLEGKIKDLQYQAKDLENKINRLKTEQSYREEDFSQGVVWARRETEKTEEKIKFDVAKAWSQELEIVVREALDSLQESPEIQIKILRKLERQARESIDRIYSMAPTNRLAGVYEQFLLAVKMALDGDQKAAKEKLETLR